MRQIPLPIGTRAPRTFEAFVAGANAAALVELAGLASGAAPVYLWGPEGSGKTHLLEAAAHRARQRGDQVVAVDASEPAPWAMGESCGLVVIDECDRLDNAQQHAAFALFIEAASMGIPVLAAGRVPPVDLSVRDDLRTRLGWGPVFELQPLAEADARAVLRREADRRGIVLSEEVLGYLLTRFERDLKHLMAQLDRLDDFALENKRAVTVPLLRQMLSAAGPSA